MRKTSPKASDNALFFFITALAVLLIVRVAAIFLTQLNLGPDEAQYWRWGQTFDWGYFSKPPFVAWTIGAVTSVFGDAAWAVRLPSPFFHIGTSICLYLAGREIWSEKVGIFAGLNYALMGGVWLSSLLMTTDVALLFFWSAGLYALARLRTRKDFVSALVLGMAIGLGFLSKYAMIYFLIGLSFTLIVDKQTRSAFFGLKGALTALIALAWLVPHIIWNTQNGFKTVSHTADNANWGADLYNPENAIKFLGDQLGVFGPVHFILLLVFIALVVVSRLKILQQDRFLLALLGFIIPPLAIITVQAFISRAHANWAASAYPAACILLSWWAVQYGGRVRIALFAGFAFNILLGVIFTVFAVLPHDTQVALGGARSTKRLTAWPETVAAANDLAKKHGVSAIIVDEREIWHGLDYYGRDGVVQVPVRAWRRQPYAKSASEEAPITDEIAKNALVLSYRVRDREKLLADFETNTYLGPLSISLGGKYKRAFEVYLVSGFDPKQPDLQE